MQIYVLRHGIAEIGRPGVSDSARALVPDGKKKLRQILRAVRGAGVNPALILTSPYKRAVETAEIAGKVLGYAGEIIKTDALRPGSNPEAVWEELRTFKSEERILVTGHDPLLSYVIGYLLGAPSLLVDLKKGAIICIDVDAVGLQPRGVLRWYVTPKLVGGGR